jgi:Ran GTPase-activating protein (RanGAP) involved in mRNA processing and transport
MSAAGRVSHPYAVSWDSVVEASEGDEFPKGKGLLKKLQDIRSPWHITVLRLRDCKLYCQGGIELAKFLYGNTTLRELDVSKNQLDKEGGEAIYNALYNNTTLENLNISRNKLGYHATLRCDGMHHGLTQHFARLLCGNASLKSLDISHNLLTNDDIIEFASAVHSEGGGNTTLTSLAIGGHDLRGGGAMRLAETLRHNTTLTRLDLQEAFLTSGDVDSLETAVNANTTLRELDLRSVQGEVQFHNLLDLRPVITRGQLSSPRPRRNPRIIV